MLNKSSVFTRSISVRLLSSSTGASSSVLKTYLLEYHYVENMLERRTPHRAAHLNYANDFVKKNILIAGGAILPEVDRGVLVLKAESKATVEDFAKSDPYVKNGLVKNYTVKEWAVVVGKL